MVQQARWVRKALTPVVHGKKGDLFVNSTGDKVYSWDGKRLQVVARAPSVRSKR